MEELWGGQGQRKPEIRGNGRPQPSVDTFPSQLSCLQPEILLNLRHGRYRESGFEAGESAKLTAGGVSRQSAVLLSNQDQYGGDKSDISGKNYEPAQEERLVAGGTGGEAERVEAVGVQMGGRHVGAGTG